MSAPTRGDWLDAAGGLDALAYHAWYVTLNISHGGCHASATLDGYWVAGGKDVECEAEGDTLPECVARLVAECFSVGVEAAP